MRPPSPYRVAITAAGIVSPLGLGLEENLGALLSGGDGVGPVRLFDPSGCRSHTAAEVDDERLRAGVNGRRKRLHHRASLMMMTAMRELLEGDPSFRPEEMVVGTTSGGMSYGEAFYRSIITEKRKKKDTAAWLVHYSPVKAVLDAQEHLCLEATPCQIIANACASGTNALGHAFQKIRHGLSTRLVAGGYDAISEMVFAGFDSLQASTPERCRPFDKGRTGLVLGEGAALFALEEWESAQRRGAPILAEIIGYGVSTDNHHLTQPHPSGIGPQKAMQRALASAGVDPGSVDYINAHGTATPFNDATEGVAIETLFGKRGVAVSSTKGVTGHTLGAAGALEALFSILALQHDFMPANANYQEADPQWDLDIVANEVRFGSVRRVLSNSFGFGGTNASILLQKAEVKPS